MSTRAVLTALITTLVATAAMPAAATSVYRSKVESIPVHTGTGFFVSTRGHAVTNHHVVEGCKEVTLRGAVPEMKARVVATDKTYDLALLKAETDIRRPANLRELHISRLEEGESLLLMGYPLDSFKTGQYQIAEATITGLQGPTNEPHFIQFSDSVQKGNSGGPVLDSAGNVAGVVVGKSFLYSVETRTGREELLKTADIAISLPILTRFLEDNRVNFKYNAGQGYMMNRRIEEAARGYIVNVICERPDLKRR